MPRRRAMAARGVSSGRRHPARPWSRRQRHSWPRARADAFRASHTHPEPLGEYRARILDHVGVQRRGDSDCGMRRLVHWLLCLRSRALPFCDSDGAKRLVGSSARDSEWSKTDLAATLCQRGIRRRHGSGASWCVCGAFGVSSVRHGLHTSRLHGIDCRRRSHRFRVCGPRWTWATLALGWDRVRSTGEPPNKPMHRTRSALPKEPRPSQVIRGCGPSTASESLRQSRR